MEEKERLPCRIETSLIYCYNDQTLKLRLQSGGIFAGSRQSLGGFSLLDQAHIIRFNKIDGLYITEPDTLRIAVAEITLENAPVDSIETHCAEWAYTDACAAADTDIIVHHYAARARLL